MITINVSLSDIDTIISNLESSVANFHHRALDRYPEAGYESFDYQSVECRRSLDFFVLTKSLKELELGCKELESEIQYFEFRITQLEQFLYKDSKEHTADLMHAINDIHAKLIEKKHQKHICTRQLFAIEVPENIIINLKNLGLLSVSN